MFGKLMGSEDKTQILMEEALPKVEVFIFQKLKEVGDEKLQDDAQLAEVFGTVYEVLPGLVKLAVKQPMFVDFCMQQKDPLLEKYYVYRDEKLAEANS